MKRKKLRTFKIIEDSFHYLRPRNHLKNLTFIIINTKINPQGKGETKVEKPISYCCEVANISTDFEKNRSELKREYLKKQIELYTKIVKKIAGHSGSFGTGYPFYAIGSDLNGPMPYIKEQVRYNEELKKWVQKSNYQTWNCATCLEQNGEFLPDLKQLCKPCPYMDNELKPRKIINRLPDLDLWMICEEKKIETAKKHMIKLFQEYQIAPSDIDPLKSIEELSQIVESLKNGSMPQNYLPIDTHIIGSARLATLIAQTPFVIKESLKNNIIPYLPIHPISLRKSWQYDDTAYNFIHDYLSSLTPYNWNPELQDLLDQTRRQLALTYKTEELYECLLMTGSDSTKRRQKTKELQDSFKERIESWKN